MEVDEAIVLPYVRTGDFEELHSSYWHMRGRKFHAEFFILPCKGYAAKLFTKIQVWGAIWETTYQQTGLLWHACSIEMTVMPHVLVRHATQRVSVK
jgi:hypothetical protein